MSDAEQIIEWAAVIDQASYYEILGVLELADDSAIKDAFHTLAAAFHPDLHRGAAPEVREAAAKVYMRGVEAYRALSEETKRAKYDLLLAKGQVRLDKGSAPPVRDPSSREIQTLEDVCTSAAARRHAQQAEHFLVTGDLEAAKRELQLALAQDGGRNPRLEERIDALDLVLFAAGH